MSLANLAEVLPEPAAGTTTKIDPVELGLCRAHVALCRRLSRVYCWVPLTFFVARARATCNRPISQEAYWGAAEAEGVAVRDDSEALELRLDPDAAWALLAAANDRSGREIFYGFHPMPFADRAHMWDRVQTAMQLLSNPTALSVELGDNVDGFLKLRRISYGHYVRCQQPPHSTLAWPNFGSWT